MYFLPNNVRFEFVGSFSVHSMCGCSPSVGDAYLAGKLMEYPAREFQIAVYQGALIYDAVSTNFLDSLRGAR